MAPGHTSNHRWVSKSGSIDIGGKQPPRQSLFHWVHEIGQSVRVRLVLTVLLLSLLSANSAAQVPLRIGPEFEAIDLQPYAQMIVDEHGDLGPEQILERTDLRLSTMALNNLGLASDAVWIRFNLTPTSNGPKQVLLSIDYPLLDQVTLYLSHPDGRMQRFEAGDTIPFGERPLNYREPTFEIPLYHNGSTVGILRLQTEGSLQFPLTLWDANVYAEHVAADQFYFGLYYGVFAVLALLAGITYSFTRDSTFLLYGLHLLSFAVLQLSFNGFIAQYLWSYGDVLPSRAPPILTGITMVLMALFAIRFLGFWHNAPALRRSFSLFLILSAATVIIGAVGPAALSMLLACSLGILLLPLILATGFVSLRRGVRAARYFIIAWALFLIGVSVTGLTSIGLLPISSYTTYAMQIGSGLEIWVLAVALLDRVRILREEKESAVESANHYLSQLNAELGVLVAERTRALEATNAQLRDMADRDSLTGLLNHRSSNESLNALLMDSGHGGDLVAVIMLDIDFFKIINDRFGHQQGDRVLVAVAEVLQRNTTAGGICGRYGGEEFLVAERLTDRATAAELGDRLLQQISSLSFKVNGSFSINASLGIALAFPETDVFAEHLIHRADKALYTAKREGRNRLVFAPDVYSPAQVVPLRS